MSWADLGLWLAIIASGILTFATRFSMIGLFHRRELPPIFKNLLLYIGPAALSALVFPDILFVGSEMKILANAEIPAFILAVIVAYFSRNIVATIAIGMASLWAIEYLIELTKYCPPLC